MAVFAIGLAQIFGGQNSYLCLDQGQPQIISAEHCHKDASTKKFTACTDAATSDCFTDGDVSQHAPLNLEAKSPTSADIVSAPQFIPGLLADLSAFEWLVGLTARVPQNALLAHSTEYVPPQKGTSLMVVECEVLLV